MAETNLRLLRPSRKAPRPGDVFIMQPDENLFLFGRVISTDAVWTLAEGATGALLIYIYSTRSTTRELPDRDELRPANLLLSPIMTNRLPWSRGYFETVGHIALDDDDVLNQHCFLSVSRGAYFDEKGNQLPRPIEPVGDFGLHSYRTIDDQISDAVGIPRSSGG